MKHKILLFALIVMSSATMAQNTPSFFVKAGVASSEIKGDAIQSLQKILEYSNGMVSTGRHTGFFVGAGTSLYLGDMLSFEPGIYYTQKGMDITGDLHIKGLHFIGASAKGALQMNYIELPLLLKADIGGLQLFAGPQISYLANADFKTTAGVLGINLLNKAIDATSLFNQWDASVTGGIGYQFPNGLSLTVAYDQGLLKPDANRNVKAFNNSIKAGIGFRF